MANKEDKCPVIRNYAAPNQIGVEKSTPACNTPNLKLPQELREPTGTIAPVQPLHIPRSVVLKNVSVTVECDDVYVDAEGADVTIPAGAFTSEVSITTIAGIDDSALNYIAENSVIDELEIQAETRTITVDSIIALTKITRSQATAFYNIVQAAHVTLDQSARTLALSQLQCLWWNDVQDVTCSDVEMATSNEAPTAVFRVVVAEHTVSSAVSKLDANTQAHTQALAGLNCFYVNDPFTATCITREDRPIDIMEPVPTDDPNDPDGAKVFDGTDWNPAGRVGEFYVAPGTFISTSSKADANYQAELFAWSQLVCYYINKEVEKQCEVPDYIDVPEGEDPWRYTLARNMWEDPKKTNPKEANPIYETSGQYIKIPAGFFTSDISTAAATEEAELLAQALIECCYINNEQTITCEPDEDGNEASPTKSPVYTVSVARGLFASCVSQEAADALALASIQGMLECLYCNDRIIPYCVPEWVVEAATTGIYITEDVVVDDQVIYYKGELYKLELPLDVDALINPYNPSEKINLRDWSVHATSGIEADSICSERRKKEAQEIATTIANTPIKQEISTEEGENCTYYSPRILVGCSFKDPYAPYDEALSCPDPDKAKDSTHGNFNEYDSVRYSVFDTVCNDPFTREYRRDADGLPYVIVRLANGIAHSTYNSSVQDFDYIEWEAGLMQMSPTEVPWLNVEDKTPDELKAATVYYMQELLITMAAATVQCQYANPPMAVSCNWARKISTGAVTDPTDIATAPVKGKCKYFNQTAAVASDKNLQLTVKEQTAWKNNPSIAENHIEMPVWPAKDNAIEQRLFINKILGIQYETGATEPCKVEEVMDPDAVYWWYGAQKPEGWNDRLVSGAPTSDEPILIAPGTIIGPDYTTVLRQTLILAHSLIDGRCKYVNEEVCDKKVCACGGIKTPRTHLITSTEIEIAVTIPRGTVQADTPEEADELAKKLADIEFSSKCPCLYGNDPLYCDCWEFLMKQSWGGINLPWDTPPTPEMLEDMITKHFYLPEDTIISEDPYKIEAALENQLNTNCAELVCKAESNWMIWSSGKATCKCCCNSMWNNMIPSMCGPQVLDGAGNCISLTFQEGAQTGSERKLPWRMASACWEQCTLLSYLAQTGSRRCASFQIDKEPFNLPTATGITYHLAPGNVRLASGKVYKTKELRNFFETLDDPTTEDEHNVEFVMKVKKVTSGAFEAYIYVYSKDRKKLLHTTENIIITEEEEKEEENS